MFTSFWSNIQNEISYLQKTQQRWDVFNEKLEQLNATLISIHEALNDGLRSDDLEFEKYKFQRTIVDFHEKLEIISHDLKKENHEFISEVDFLVQLQQTFGEYEQLSLDTFKIYEKRDIKSSLIYYSNSSAVYYRLNFMVSELQSIGNRSVQNALTKHQKNIDYEYSNIRIMLVILIFFFFSILFYFKYLSEKLFNSRRELAKKSKVYEDFYNVIYTHSIVSKADIHGKIIFANENFEKISGYKSSELIGKSHNIVNSKFHAKEFFDSMWKTISRGEIWRGQIRNKRKDGTYYWVDSTISPIKNDRGEILEYLAIRQDITIQKDFEQDLKFKNSYYEELLQNMSDGMVVQVESGEILLSNKKASEILQLPVEKLNKRSSYDKEWRAIKLDGKPLDGGDHPAMAVFKKKKTISKFIMGLQYNQFTKWLEVTSTPIFSDDTKNEVTYSVTLFRDITEDKFNKDLEFSINVLKSLYLEHKFNNIFYCEILEEINRVIKSNFAFFGQFEKDKNSETILHVTAMENSLWQNEERQRLNQIIQHSKLVFDSNSLFQAPFITRKPFFINNQVQLDEVDEKFQFQKALENFISWPLFDGEEVVGVLIIANSLDDFNEKFIDRFARYFNQINDLYLKVLKDEQQNLYNKKLQLLVNNSGSSFVKIDIYKNEIEVDESFLNQLNLQSFEAPSNVDEFMARIYPAEQNNFKESFSAAIEKNIENFEYKYHLQDGEGNWIPFVLKGKFLFNTEEAIFVGTQIELSYIEKLENDLNQQKSIALHNQKLAAIGELAAGVGHEINNPLAIIQGLVQKLKKSSEQRGTVDSDKAIILNITNSISRIKNIVSGLRNFARNDEFKLEELDLNLCIKDILELVDNIYKNDDLMINYSTDVQSPIVLAETGKVHQVILNLLNNARDAYKDLKTKKEKIISINLSHNGEFYQLKISDNASGIAKNDLEKIFDAFYTTKEIGEGTGLGLFIISGIIKEFNGSISVESELGLGTTFIIKLPILNHDGNNKETKSLEKLEVQMNDKPWLGKKLLFVDDEPLLREILKDISEEFGAEVYEAENGVVALEQIRSHHFDIVVTDMKMPQMGGEELVKALASENLIPMKKVVLMTGGTNVDIEKLVVDLGIFGIIKKPYNDDDVIKCFNELLKK